MPIHWFPGHMAKARDQIREAMSGVDLVLEVLDARIPWSSENPLVADLIGEKPRLRVLNKADLAEPAVTAAWVDALRATPRGWAVAHQREQVGLRAALMEAATALGCVARGRPLTAMILGVPNVGKSTIINLLAGRAVARAGNQPALTQAQQRFPAGKGLSLLDTPGFLWPRLHPEVCGVRLALCGAIPDRLLNHQELVGPLAGVLRARRPQGANALGLDAWPDEDHGLLEALGRRRGLLRRGGVVDLDRAAERLVLDFRAGAFGPLSLERPQDAGQGS